MKNTNFILKPLLAISLLSTLGYSFESRFLVHGFSKHFKDYDKTGEYYNEKHNGIGLEITSYTPDKNLFYSFSINQIKDSYNNDFPFASIGVQYRADKYPISVGIDTMGGWKKQRTWNGQVFGEYQLLSESYQPIFGVSPNIKLYLKDFSIHYNYSPTFAFNNIYIEGFHYLSFGYKFHSSF